MTKSAWIDGVFFSMIITADELAKLGQCWPAFASSMWLLMGPSLSSHSGFNSSLFFLLAIHTQTYGPCPSPPLGIARSLCPSMLHIIVLCVFGWCTFQISTRREHYVSSRNLFLVPNCQYSSLFVSYPIMANIGH